MLRWQVFFLAQISFDHRIIFVRDDWVNDDDDNEFKLDGDDHFNEYDNNDDDDTDNDDDDDDELAVLSSKCL